MSAHASTFYVTGGTLRHDAACYVERQAEDLDADLAATLEAREIAAPTAGPPAIHVEAGETSDEAAEGGPEESEPPAEPGAVPEE